MCHSRVLDRAIMPLAIDAQRHADHRTRSPGLAIALGFGYSPKFVVTAVIVFFPFLVNGLAGLRSVDPAVLEVFRTLDASRWEILVRLRLPSSLPFLFAARTASFPLSLVGAVVSEVRDDELHRRSRRAHQLRRDERRAPSVLAEIYGLHRRSSPSSGLVLTLIVARSRGTAPLVAVGGSEASNRDRFDPRREGLESGGVEADESSSRPE